MLNQASTEFIEEFKSIEDIAEEYSSSKEGKDAILLELNGATILLAWYGYGNYEGDSFVLFEKDGKLYENHGAHCSCYGLEGQWEPEETTWKALAMRDLSDSYCDGSEEADRILKELVKKNLPEIH